MNEPDGSKNGAWAGVAGLAVICATVVALAWITLGGC